MENDQTGQENSDLPLKDRTSTNTSIRRLFWEAKKIAIASHIRPDGDAVGSLLGLGLALKAAGKEVQMVLVDGVPANMRHLPGSEQVQKQVEGEVDLRVTVDSSELSRIGGVFYEKEPDIEIDHHITNAYFAKVNLVVEDAVATCAIIAESMPEWGLIFDAKIASALLTGMVTDTIGFRTANMTPKALQLAARMMEYGANLPDLYSQVLVAKTFEAVHYWGLGLEKVKQENGLIWTSLSLNDRKEAHYPGNDDADLVNILSSVDGSVAVIFIEQKQGRVKVSWRARPGIDVSQIALQFGGGGHAAAAGADIAGTLQSVQDQVLSATRSLLATVNKERSAA